MKYFKNLIKEQGFFIIAECGVNYYDIARKMNISLIEAAKMMIDEAQENGSDAVKFQTYKAEKIAVKDSPAYWDLNEEPTRSQFELFKKYDHFNEEDYKILSKYCESKQIIFLSTPFDFEAANYLNELMPFFKISASDITNLPFIKHISKKGKPVLLSTGASTLGEIEKAVNTINSSGNENIGIMHCILSYPTEDKDANLNMIKFLQNVFPEFLIGYSDHTKPILNMLIPTLAYTYGAKIIEKHFTLDKTIKGNDHYHAMDPSDLRLLRHNLGKIQEINGLYRKTPLKCEETSRRQARRSIVAKKAIKKGEIIKEKDLTFKRPGTGISPSFFDDIVGSTTLDNIQEDEIINLNKIKLKVKK